jgi:hypothetical protein
LKVHNGRRVLPWSIPLRFAERCSLHTDGWTVTDPEGAQHHESTGLSGLNHRSMVRTFERIKALKAAGHLQSLLLSPGSALRGAVLGFEVDLARVAGRSLAVLWGCAVWLRSAVSTAQINR